MAQYVLGLDVSTTCTGMCLLDSTVEPDDKGSHIVLLDKIEFKGCKNIFEKADCVELNLQQQLKKYLGDISGIAIEEPLMGFRTGMSSAATITTLMRFNGIVSYLSRRLIGIDPQYIPSSSARKLCGIKMQKTAIAKMSGKEQVFKYMMEHDLKHISWPKKKNGTDVDWSRDAVDSYVIARASCLLNK